MTQQQIEEAVMGFAELKERIEILEKEVEILKERTGIAEVDEEGNVTIIQQHLPENVFLQEQL